MCSVRGMGVALMLRTCTFVVICLSRSLCRTPKRCSSSTTSNPRSRNTTSFENRRCVPTAISIFPSASSSIDFFSSLAGRRRENISMRTGNAAKRCLSVSKCWNASTVVGASTATCFPSPSALNAARMATSVLPKPTSPQSSRSMGCGDSRSRLISLVAVSWSLVSVNSKASSNSRCQLESGESAKPSAMRRWA